MFEEDISPGSGDPKNLLGKFTAYMWTIEFLIQEGLIRNVQKEKEKELLESQDRGTFRPRGVSLVFPHVVLTAKGLAMLNVTPKILKGQPLTLIERLRKALSENSKKGVNEVITSLISSTALQMLS